MSVAAAPSLRTAPTASEALCGGVMIEVNSRTPYMPRFETVNEPPSRSVLPSLRCATRPRRSRSAVESAASGRRSV